MKKNVTESSSKKINHFPDFDNEGDETVGSFAWEYWVPDEDTPWFKFTLDHYKVFIRLCRVAHQKIIA